MNSNVEAAYDELKKARKILSDAMNAAYPKGTIIKARLGANMTAIMEVERHVCIFQDFDSCEYLPCINLKTGQHRRVHVVNILEVIA